MKNSTEEIDDLIKNALSQEEAKFYNDLDEQSLLDNALSVYRGKLGWIAVITTIVILIGTALFIYCLMMFLEAEDTKQMILWAAGMFGALSSISMLKLFHWMQMDKNSILRELKRVELQVAVLASKLNKDN